MTQRDADQNFVHQPPLTNGQIKDIHQATIRILCETGMWIGNPNLLEMAKSRGLYVDDQIVRFTEETIDQALTSAGNHVEFKARNPEYSLTLGLDTVGVGMGRSAPFVMGRDGIRRTANCKDYIEFMKIGHSLKEIQLPGPLVFPGEIPEAAVYPFMMAAQIRYSDKPLHLTTDTDIDLLLMAMGLTADALKRDAQKGIFYGQITVNSLSPLALTQSQGRILINAADHGIPICLSPTPAAGSTGPCDIMGNLMLNNCEILGMLVFSQWIRPGLPVFYGAFPSGSDMRTMNATYGGPESAKMQQAAGLMAKHYNLLSRSNLINDAQTSDFQAGAESLFTLLSAFQGRVNFIPGCGLLSSFASASKAKLVLDAELAAYARYYSTPVTENPEALENTVRLIQDIGPRGNYVTSPHTFSNFKTVLHHPDLFSRIAYEKWLEGRADLIADAQSKADTLLENYTQPPIDADLDRRLAELCKPGL